MNPNDLVKAIRLLKPNSEFSFQGTDYSTIKWDVIDGDEPTWAEIQAAHQQIKSAEEAEAEEAKIKREALLARLGITEEEAKLLLG
jgi:hypothetical protein